MKIFVFGSTGMLGNYVINHLHRCNYNVVPVSRKNADMTKISDRTLLNSNIGAGDIIINCVGLIKQRANVTDYDFIKINTLFPHMLANVCEHKDAKLIQISTDCVYSGIKGGYDENSIHDATDIYGRSKSLGEPANATVIRTSIIGEERSNFLSLLEWVKSNKNGTVCGFTNHLWNGITCLKFAEICDFIIKNDMFWSSVKHVFSPEVVSKYQLINIISEIYSLDINVFPTTHDQKCDRTLKTIRDDIFIPVEGLEEQIHRQMRFKIQG